MDNVDDLLSKKRKYKNLKTNIKTIIEKLESTIENLETPANKIKGLYNIDSISIDEGKLNFVRQNLIDRKNYLKNTILNSINKKINEIEDSIESAG